MKQTDAIVFERKENERQEQKYAHVRVGVKHFKEITRIAEECSLNNRQVADALFAFALERVKLVERPLYKMEQEDIGEDTEVEDED